MIALETRGLDKFEEMIRRLGESSTPAQILAINDTARFARRLGSAAIRRELNIKAKDLSSDLTVTSWATAGDPEATVSGKDRPSSLAGFSNSPRRGGRQKVAPRVKVRAAGGNQPMKGAFFMALRNGNWGLAIRLKPGESVRNKKQMTGTNKGVYLLYGPSVGQAFRSAAERELPAISDYLEVQFVRQMERFLRG